MHSVSLILYGLVDSAMTYEATTVSHACRAIC